MRQRNFKTLEGARRIFETRVQSAKAAMQKDLETLEGTATTERGTVARVVQMAAIHEYDRALLAAWHEYLKATTDVIPDDDEGRLEHAEQDLLDRVVRHPDPSLDHPLRDVDSCPVCSTDEALLARKQIGADAMRRAAGSVDLSTGEILR